MNGAGKLIALIVIVAACSSMAQNAQATPLTSNDSQILVADSDFEASLPPPLQGDQLPPATARKKNAPFMTEQQSVGPPAMFYPNNQPLQSDRRNVGSPPNYAQQNFHSAKPQGFPQPQQGFVGSQQQGGFQQQGIPQALQQQWFQQQQALQRRDQDSNFPGNNMRRPNRHRNDFDNAGPNTAVNGFPGSNVHAGGNQGNRGGNQGTQSSQSNQERKPDRFADHPMVDADGVRHFGNGKHIDLSQVPIDQAIAMTRDPDPAIVPPKVKAARTALNSYAPPMQIGAAPGQSPIQSMFPPPSEQTFDNYQMKEQIREARRRARRDRMMNQQF